MTLLTMQERIDLREKLRSLYFVCDSISDTEIKSVESTIRMLTTMYETFQLDQKSIVEFIQNHITTIVCNTRNEISTLCFEIWSLTTCSKEEEHEE